MSAGGALIEKIYFFNDHDVETLHDHCSADSASTIGKFLSAFTRGFPKTESTKRFHMEQRRAIDESESNSLYLDNDTVDVSDQHRLILNGGAPSPADSDDRSRRLNPFGNATGVYDNSRHCHPQVAAPRDKSAQRTLLTVSVICFIFMVAEFVGGFLADSLAIMTDAAHMLSDFAAFMISLLAIWLAQRSATKRMSFGFYRAEILGAVVSILVIWILTAGLVYTAIDRIVNGLKDIKANIMLITAGVGVLFNIIMGIILHRGGHGHSHGLGHRHSHSHSNSHSHSHSHGHGHGHGHGHESAEENRINMGDDDSQEITPTNLFPPVRFSVSAYPTDELHHVNKQKNINVRAAFIHVIGDLVQSVGVFIAALIIKFKPEWKLADPICTFVFSVLVLITTCTVLRDAVYVLMEGTPRDVDYDQVKKDLESIEGVKSAHSLHMWSLTMDKAALAVHLAIDTSCDALKIMHEASKKMRFKYNLTFTTIQVEPYDREIMSTCTQCLGPS